MVYLETKPKRTMNQMKLTVLAVSAQPLYEEMMHHLFVDNKNRSCIVAQKGYDPASAEFMHIRNKVFEPCLDVTARGSSNNLGTVRFREDVRIDNIRLQGVTTGDYLPARYFGQDIAVPELYAELVPELETKNGQLSLYRTVELPVLFVIPHEPNLSDMLWTLKDRTSRHYQQDLVHVFNFKSPGRNGMNGYQGLREILSKETRIKDYTY